MGYFGQWSVNLCQSGQNSLAGIFHVWVMIYTGTDPGWEPAWYTILGRIVYPYPQLEATVDNGKTIRNKESCVNQTSSETTSSDGGVTGWQDYLPKLGKYKNKWKKFSVKIGVNSA